MTVAGSEMFQPGEVVAGNEVVGRLGTLGVADRYLVRGPGGARRMLGVVQARHVEMAPRLRALHLERIRHPNVVALLDVADVGPSPALVTEPISGTTLRERLSRGPVAPEEALAMFRGLVQGVGAAHAAGITHRDLRPDNVALDEGVPRILDMGVATVIFELAGAGRSVTTTSGMTLGKPHYWAPERARRPQGADERADLFSLGCILYELFAGQGPFAGLDLYDCYHATLEERYVPLEQRRPDAPTGVLRLVPRLLRAEAARRPRSCAEVLELLDQPPTEEDQERGTVDTLAPRAPALRPLGRTGVVVAALCGAALLAALALSWFVRS